MSTLIHYSIFWIGFQFFKVTKKTLSYPYYSFRKLFVLTKGKINDNLSETLRKETGQYQLPTRAGVLGDLSESDLTKIINGINKDGFFIFENKLDAQLVERLRTFALKADATLMPPAADGRTVAKYESAKPLSPKYDFDEQMLMENELIQDLATDFSMLAVAQAYLGAKPIQDLTAMWWSTAFSKKASSEAAQLYHFDMDRFKFIKFFFYLTDVDTNTGPHCYVRGTHNWLPDRLWKDGRIADSEVEAEIKKDNFVEIVGSKGTIIAVDTRGLHKGKPLQGGERLILQFEFTNSLFGAPYKHINLKNKISGQRLNVLKSYPYTFQRFDF